MLMVIIIISDYDRGQHVPVLAFLFVSGEPVAFLGMLLPLS